MEWMYWREMDCWCLLFSSVKGENGFSGLISRGAVNPKQQAQERNGLHISVQPSSPWLLCCSFSVVQKSWQHIDSAGKSSVPRTGAVTSEKMYSDNTNDRSFIDAKITFFKLYLFICWFYRIIIRVVLFTLSFLRALGNCSSFRFLWNYGLSEK